MREEIVKALEEALRDLGLEDIHPALESPEGSAHGDYSSNVALISAKKVGKNPVDLAMEIKDKLGQIQSIEKIEVVPPGFINFWLAKDFLVEQMKETPKMHLGESLKNKKIMVEFTDPNPFKEFHVGHLYSNIVGESLSRLLESQGATVWRVNYQGDIGLHVAKAIWGIQNGGVKMDDLEKKSLKTRAQVLGQCYAEGSRAYEENETAKKEINEINKKVYEGENPEIMEIYKKGREWTLDYFEIIYKRLGTRFDRYYFESEAGPIGLTLVKEHVKKGIFKESEGAIIFEGEKYGLHNRVFINSLGLPTYEAKDLGLPPTKYKDFQYDQSIIVTGNEINAYFKVLLKALSLINADLAAKTLHIGHGMVRLPIGKMSSRTGSVITGEWLLDEAKKRILKAYPDMDRESAEQVTIGAVKYALLKSGIGQDIIFDFDTSISLEGDSGPYLQYTYARAQSVLAKSRTTNEKLLTINKLEVSSEQLAVEELELLRLLHHFPDVVSEAQEHISPNLLCTYLFDLAQTFNLFYQKHHILDSDTKEFRLALTASLGHILKNGLHLLGIEAPDRM